MTEPTNSTHVDFERVFDIVSYQEIKFPQKKALNDFVKGKWRNFSISEIKQKIDSVACWFIENGFIKGDTIAIVPQNGNPMWMILDFACQQVGIITVPIHATSPRYEVEFIVKETEAKLCVTAESGLYYKLKNILDVDPSIKLFHLEQGMEGYFSPLSLKSASSSNLEKLVEHKKAVAPSDLVVIMYTSGTSGVPKGVMLTHQNIVSNIKSVLAVLPLKPSDRVLSFLPYSHVLERTTSYAYLAIGAELYFNHDVNSLGYDFKSVKPYFCTAVPRTLEKMYDLLHEQRLERNKLVNLLIKWSMDLAEKFKDTRKQTVFYGFKLFWARLLVLNAWHKKLGGKIKYIGVGAAALRPEIGRSFSAAGVHTLVGYGLTEASPFVTVNRPGMNKHGTVGVPIPGVEVKIDSSDGVEEGEILIKGPNVMPGYFKRTELTKEVFAKGGWFRTGDIGKLTDKHYLVITDRKKDIFKTSSGKYIAPQPLEAHLVGSRFIIQSMIVGFNRPYVTALLVPNFALLYIWCQEQGIHWTSPQFMVHNIKVVERIQLELNELNEALEGHKKIRKFVLCQEEWTSESNYLTVSLKLIRDRLEEKYKKEIEEMYKS